MEIVRGLYNLRAEHRGCVLAVGNFDGVHRGHQALLERLHGHAERLGLPAMVQSFRPDAVHYFKPEAAPPAVLPLRSLVRELEACGVQRWNCLRFDARFAAFSAERYIEEVLCERLAVAALVVGADFRFGAGRAGDVALLQEAGAQRNFVVDAVDKVACDGERISSTRLRALLADGDVAAAARLLGRDYRLHGVVRHGRKLGRSIGAATANLHFRETLALRFGVYAVRIECDGRQWPGVANFGVRPTVDGGRPCLEAHALQDTGPLYGRQLTVSFVQFLRAEQRFASVDALAEQIRADAEAARAVLGMPAP